MSCKQFSVPGNAEEIKTTFLSIISGAIVCAALSMAWRLLNIYRIARNTKDRGVIESLQMTKALQVVTQPVILSDSCTTILCKRAAISPVCVSIVEIPARLANVSRVPR